MLWRAGHGTQQVPSEKHRRRNNLSTTGCLIGSRNTRTSGDTVTPGCSPSAGGPWAAVRGRRCWRKCIPGVLQQSLPHGAAEGCQTEQEARGLSCLRMRRTTVTTQPSAASKVCLHLRALPVSGSACKDSAACGQVLSSSTALPATAWSACELSDWGSRADHSRHTPTSTTEQATSRERFLLLTTTAACSTPSNKHSTLVLADTQLLVMCVLRSLSSGSCWQGCCWCWCWRPAGG